jgi:zinc D-Ala-D-Ala carboxypeptidase
MSVKSLIVRMAVSIVGGVVLAGTIATAADASTTAPYIREGSRGGGVTCVQLVLIYSGIAPSLNADGIDGPLTTAAVKKFQSSRGLSADGVVGPATGTVMDQYVRAHLTGGGPDDCYSVLPTRS